MIISGAESFLLQGGNQGILLIHGFTGNPSELILLGKYLQSKNFTVLGIRLAGHGTNEKDLTRITRDDWINSVIDGYSILRGCCQKISVVGHSMGALLSLRLSLLRPIEKIVTLAAPIFIDESLNLKLLPPREQSRGKFTRKRPRDLKNVPNAVNCTYRLIPLIAVHELMDLIEETKKFLPMIKMPILILHGTDDHTAKVDSAKFIFENVSSAQKEIKLIENMGHLLPLKEGREKIFEMTADFLTGG